MEIRRSSRNDTNRGESFGCDVRLLASTLVGYGGLAIKSGREYLPRWL